MFVKPNTDRVVTRWTITQSQKNPHLCSAYSQLREAHDEACWSYVRKYKYNNVTFKKKGLRHEREREKLRVEVRTVTELLLFCHMLDCCAALHYATLHFVPIGVRMYTRYFLRLSHQEELMVKRAITDRRSWNYWRQMFKRRGSRATVSTSECEQPLCSDRPGWPHRLVRTVADRWETVQYCLDPDSATLTQRMRSFFFDRFQQRAAPPLKHLATTLLSMSRESCRQSWRGVCSACGISESVHFVVATVVDVANLVVGRSGPPCTT